MEMNTNLGFMATYLEKDIHKAINIRGRFEDYLINFTDIDEPDSIKAAKSFAKEFKEFEDTNFSLVPMNFLYGNMSKLFSILIDDDKIAKESALRALSYSMGISKKSAEGYWNYAMENKDKMFHSHLDLFEAYNTNN